MNKDIRHMGDIKALWKKAVENNYSAEAKERLINTFLSRGKAAVMKYRQKVLSEFRVSSKEESTNNKTKEAKRISSSGAPGRSSQQMGKLDPTKVDWNKTSERDLLDGKAPVMKR
jgi:hypothetical protein